MPEYRAARIVPQRPGQTRLRCLGGQTDSVVDRVGGSGNRWWWGVVEADRVGQGVVDLGDVDRRAVDRGGEAGQGGRVARTRGVVSGVGVLGQVDQVPHDLHL